MFFPSAADKAVALAVTAAIPAAATFPPVPSTDFIPAPNVLILLFALFRLFVYSFVSSPSLAYNSNTFISYFFLSPKFKPPFLIVSAIISSALFFGFFGAISSLYLTERLLFCAL